MAKRSSGRVRNFGLKSGSVTRPLGHSTTRPLPLGIAMGDPAGIGPEVILKAVEESGLAAKRSSGRVRIIGSRGMFEQEQKRLGTKVDLSIVDDSVAVAGKWQTGRVQKSCGQAALEALEAGCEMLETGRISAFVTAPVSKEALRLAGFSWPGQTEFLADRLGAKRHAMLAWTPLFKAVFVTIHLPLAEVSRHITAEAVYEKTVMLDEFLRREGIEGQRDKGIKGRIPSLDPLVPRSLDPSFSPRICVMALNPHGFEFSRGEDERIADGVRRARRAGINAVGPVPADAALAGAGMNHRDTETRKPKTPGRGDMSVAGPLGHLTTRPLFSGFVAMYHDQAMIPAKLLGRDLGVNVTLGLPYVRTSPLHGTAFDIAGKGIARPGSMLSAICLALHLAERG